MPSHSAASCALLFSTLVLLLLPGTALSAGNVTATITSGGNNSSGTVPADNNGVEMYTCYLCSGRNPLLIHWCPIYWDECHLHCYHPSASTVAVPVREDGSGPVSPAVLPAAGETLDTDPGDDDECYVMKMYNGGRYVIVSVLKCGQTKSCTLTCGGGEDLGAGNAAPLATSSAASVAFQDPRLADFQRCGDTAVRRSGDGSDRKG